MIRRILPASVRTAEAFQDVPERGHGALLPEEQAVAAGMGEGRRREFTTVRACARTALDALGHPPAPLLPDRHGAPGWPEGVVGSMTHCRGYRAAAVARREDLRAIGIDAEPHRPLRPGVMETIGLPPELARNTALAHEDPEVRWDRLLFCAKEALYKAWFPLTGIRLSFRDAEVALLPRTDALGPETGMFRADVVKVRPGYHGPVSFEGRWSAAVGEHIVAAVVVEVPPVL
ncbi:4'-phosphopantetheinyl transferase [Streptomyces sp. NPDC102451]|uniref:4'-phosphopantetheinyl transferase family protein n=1 Tax=Streptomyces sp. NPDC102451 TaxID=3366177 RepID=UPI00380D9A91